MIGVPAGPAIVWRDHLRNVGLSYPDIAKYAKRLGFYISPETIRKLGSRSSGVDPETERAILAVEPPWTEVGLQRRIKALCADGYPAWWIAYRMECAPDILTRVCDTGRRPYQTEIAEAVCSVYEALAGNAPESMGVDPELAEETRATMTGLGYAPTLYWDYDTIDKPESFPNWTGQCGTTAGANMHYRNDIQVVEIDEDGEPHTYAACAPCRAARYEARGYVTSTESAESEEA
jgi:hypothetical protein